MKIVALMGSYRKGKTIDTLVNRAIKGVRSGDLGGEVEKIVLIDRHIEYCRNCGVCRNDDPGKRIARCAIDDDMQRRESQGGWRLLARPGPSGYTRAQILQAVHSHTDKTPIADNPS